MTGKCLPGTALEEDPDPLALVVSTAVTAGTLLVAFGLLALGVESFWIVFPIGFGGVLPLSLGLVESSHSEQATDAPRDEDEALSTLHERYARGDLSDEEFEHRVEALLETEQTS